MLFSNCTPFQFGTKITSRIAQQLEMTCFLRGTFRLVPGQPLTAIEDPIEQGFMTGDVFADDDDERAGALVYASDFADWKPTAEVLVNGTAYPPGGRSATEVLAGVSLGWWSKRLTVIGPRVWKQKVLLAASPGEAHPFQAMPLTYANAFGGPGYAHNPVGRGYDTDELPTVELPGELITSPGSRPQPASFMPISPTWPQRAGKVGTNYGAEWRKTRRPFYADDFDWTHFMSAPADQQLPGYLKGDEPLVFENLHPEQARWETQLPGLRIRTFVKNDADEYHEVRMHLDTVFADLEAGRLYLTWRGLTRVREFDRSDIVAALIASETLTDRPERAEHYHELLETYAKDPLDLANSFPPGFLEMAERLEEEEAAELAGNPVPLAERIDPFGIRAQVAAATGGAAVGAAAAASDDPFGVKSKFPPGFLDLNEQLKRGEVPVPGGLEDHPGLAKLSEVEQVGLCLMPEDQRLGSLERLVEAKQQAGPRAGEPQTLFGLLGNSLVIPEKLALPVSDEPLPVEDPRPELERLSAELTEKKQRLVDKGVDSPLLGLFDMGQRLIASSTVMAAGMLDFSSAPLAGPDLSRAKAELLKQKEQLGDPKHPTYSPEAVPKLEEGLLGIAALEAKFPPREEASEELRDFDQQDLAGHDFRGQALAGKSFAGANLARAQFQGVDLTGAVFSKANLTAADLSGATLTGARLTEAALVGATLDEARLDGADLSRAVLIGASLQGASLVGTTLDESVCSGANLAGASLQSAGLNATDLGQADLTGVDLSRTQGTKTKFTRATLVRATLTEAAFPEGHFSGADLSGADLSGAALIEADLQNATLVGARLGKAQLESAQLQESDLSEAVFDGADLRFADFTKATLERASLRGADLSLATLDKVRADGVDLSEATLGMTSVAKARLRGAKLNGTTGNMAEFEQTDLRGCDARGAELATCSLTKTNLEGADFSGANLEKVSLRSANAKGARFVQARLGGAAISEGADLTGADFNRIVAPASIWQNSILDEANFAYAQVPASHFQGVKAKGARFDAANLKGSSFHQAKLDAVVFNLADLCGADFTYATLLDVEFRNTNGYALTLLAAHMAGCAWAGANVNAAMLDEGVTL